MVPLVLFLGLVGIQLIYITPAHPAGLLVGDGVYEDGALQLEGAAFINNGSPMGELEIADSYDDFAGFVLVDKSSFVSSAGPSGGIDIARNGLLSYTIGEGDSISTIAAQFGISVNTIIWANNIRNSSFIKPGEEIIILPVSGVLHEVKKGETIDSIASLYDVPLEKIATFNKKSAVSEGDTVIVPNAKPVSSSKETYITQSNLPDAGGYFAPPIERGWNWGSLHNINAVDFSAACGTPIHASADGTVINTGSVSSWNNGYGGFIRIEHANGTETFYAHNSVNSVSVGDFVSQGDIIGEVGNTGNVSGPTGCHVHFGVVGALNPFVK